MQKVRESTWIHIHQRNFIEHIIRIFNMSNAFPAKTTAEVNVVFSKNLHEETVNFPGRELIGSLLFYVLFHGWLLVL